MNFNTLYSSHISFDQVNDPIKTEQTIFNQIKNIDLGIPYVGLPIAYSINHFGIEKTQSIIDEIEKQYSNKKIFVCQHILVNQINFGENIVFTPHTIEKDKYHFIPHYNPIFVTRQQYKKTSLRTNNFSFMGDFNTNRLRQQISNLLSDKIPVFSTGKWFFSHDEITKQSLKNKYKILLEDTKFPLCPPGTGPSTLRLFESLSSGGFPIIFNDIKLPKKLFKYCIKISIEEIYNKSLFEKFDDCLQEEVLDVYWNEFSNDNLSKSIVETIRKM